MPRFLENDLAAEAQKKGLKGRRAAKYIYGAMNNLGAMHGNKETAKGARMQATHDRQERAGTARPMKAPSGGLKALTKASPSAKAVKGPKDEEEETNPLGPGRSLRARVRQGVQQGKTATASAYSKPKSRGSSFSETNAYDFRTAKKNPGASY